MKKNLPLDSPTEALAYEARLQGHPAHELNTHVTYFTDGVGDSKEDHAVWTILYWILSGGHKSFRCAVFIDGRPSWSGQVAP